MNAPGGGERPSPFSVGLQVLGAAAGLAALAGLVGGATLWIRFDALRLPADQAVGLLPERLLLIVGVHALAGSVLIGLAVAVGLVLLKPLHADRSARTRFWVALAGLLAGGLLIAYFSVEGLDLKYQLVMYGIAIAGAAVLGAGGASRSTHRRHVALIAFAAFTLCGAALAVIRTAGRPRLEPTAALLKDQKAGVAGFYVGQTGDRLYIASLPGNGTADDPFADAAIDRVLEIPRDRVIRMVVRRPTGVGGDAGGRDQAQTLLSELQATFAPAAQGPAPAVRRDPVGAFAPLVHLDSQERFWPISVGEFLENSTLYWAHRGRCREWSALRQEHVAKLPERPATVTPHVDPVRLARSDPYEHRPAGRGCGDDERADPVPATAYTRPFEGGRPANVPRDEGFFLDLDDDRIRGAGRRLKRGRQAYFTEVPVFFEENLEGRGKRRITYWFFYAYSLSPGPEVVVKNFAHEGDWERISVLAAREDGIYTPESVRYHSHNESRDVPWDAVRTVADKPGGAATHPVAYAARNSHATYPRAGDFEQRLVFGNRRVSADDHAVACPECPQWRSWEMLRDARRQPWYGFGGAWGRAGRSSDRTGPLGPSKRKSVFRTPTQEQRQKARELETGDTAPVPPDDSAGGSNP